MMAQMRGFVYTQDLLQIKTLHVDLSERGERLQKLIPSAVII